MVLVIASECVWLSWRQNLLLLTSFTTSSLNPAAQHRYVNEFLRIDCLQANMPFMFGINFYSLWYYRSPTFQLHSEMWLVRAWTLTSCQGINPRHLKYSTAELQIFICLQLFIHIVLFLSYRFTDEFCIHFNAIKLILY